MRPDRKFWRAKDGEREQVQLAEANLVGSHLSGGGHSPVLDLDYEVSLVPSTTPGHFHLYLDGLEMDDDTYDMLLQDLAAAGVIQQGFANQFERHGQTFLRPPGVQKAPGDGLNPSGEQE
jgi:hypothetical protein